MNYKSISYILGWIMKVEGVFLLLPLAVSLLYREKTWPVFLACALLSFILGTALSFKRPENTQFYAREGYVGVALGWIVMSLIGALPFYFTGEIPSFTDSLFEIIRLYHNGSQHPGSGGGSVPWYPVLEKLFTLDRRYGRSGICSADPSYVKRADNASDACGKPGAFREQACAENTYHGFFPLWNLCGAHSFGNRASSFRKNPHV